jgi:AcrR family transcriptional regulator
MSSGTGSAPGGEAGRRSYDSPVRRAQVAETRERILDAGSALVHEFESWDWRPLTFRAVAERAGVGERTVYRHFATEQALHEAVMQRLGEESGVVYEGLTIDEVSRIGAKVFASMATFAAPSWNDDETGVFLAEDERRKAALVAAVEATTTGWTDEERTRAAAALDVLWTAPSYQRLVTGWKLGADEAADVIDWMITLVADAIRAGHAPTPARRP